MNLRRCWLVVLVAVLAVGGCVYQPVVVTPQSTVQERFDRAWSAAAGAMYDQGVAITMEDRANGLLRGERGGTTITVAFRTRPDSSIEVRFTSSGTNADANLVNRVSDSYDRRMGM